MSSQVLTSTASPPENRQTLAEPARGTGRVPGLVTVVVSCCGQLEYTRLCVPSLLRHSRAPYELLFLDCGSLDGTAEYLAGLASGAAVRVEVVRVSSDPGPAKGRGEDVIQIRGEFVVLLNNDTIVTEGWLERLIRVANMNEMIGIVGPMSNASAPPLHVEQVPYRLTLGSEKQPAEPAPRVDLASLAVVEHFAREWAETHKNEWSEVEQLGGGCALLKRVALQKVGGAPTRTALGAFEIEGLAQRLRQGGYRLARCGELFIHNFATRAVSRRGSSQ